MKVSERMRAELAEKQDRERTELDRRLAILEAIPDELADVEWFAHASRLYDRKGSLHANYNRYSSIQKHPNPTLETARLLALAFPEHLPLMLFRSGTVGIRTAANVEAMPETERANANIGSIAPFWVEIQPEHETRLHWIACIAGMPIDCVVEFPNYGPLSPLGQLSLHYKRYSGGEVISVERNDYVINEHFRVFGNCTARQIRYSSGDHKTAGHHLIYWENGSVDEPTAQLTDLIDRLMEFQPKASEADAR